MLCFQGSADKLKAELRVVEAEKKQLQKQYLEAMQRVSQLETKLDKANAQTRLLEDKLKAVQEDNACSDMSELQLVRAQLVHKTQLLDKVKILLQRAAAKEKMLHEKTPTVVWQDEGTIFLSC
jgi:predicted  nucleic acid-binding Zn-ribbon protein